jgi:hypothetical protein
MSKRAYGSAGKIIVILTGIKKTGVLHVGKADSDM